MPWPTSKTANELVCFFVFLCCELCIVYFISCVLYCSICLYCSFYVVYVLPVQLLGCYSYNKRSSCKRLPCDQHEEGTVGKLGQVFSILITHTLPYTLFVYDLQSLWKCYHHGVTRNTAKNLKTKLMKCVRPVFGMRTGAYRHHHRYGEYLLAYLFYSLGIFTYSSLKYLS